MFQSWKILTRDVARLARTPKAWIILIGVLIMPALYSWVNISAFWDPYSATENIAVAVVNEDRGATTPVTGPVNVGDQVVQQLETNTQIGWRFMAADQAHEALMRSKVYASITIPPQFSEDLLSILGDHYTKPTLHYEVNTKRNAISPIITDTASAELSNQIASAFKEQIAAAVSTKLKDGGTELTTTIDQAQSQVLDAFTHTSADITATRTKLSDLDDKLQAAKDSASNAQSTIDRIEAAISDTQDALADVQTLSTAAQESITTFTDLTSSAFVQATSAAAEAAAQARVSVADAAGMLGTSGERISAATDQVNVALKDTNDALDTLQQLVDSSSLSAELRSSVQTRLDALKETQQRNQTLVDDLTALSTNATTTVTTVRELAQDVDQAAQATNDSAQALRTTVASTIPQVNTALGNLNYSAGSLSAALVGQESTIAEAKSLIAGIIDQLSATQSVLSSFDADLAAAASGVDSIRNDVHALNAVSRSHLITTLTGLDVTNIGEFFAHPVEVTSVPLFPVGTYGSAMAALFTNLSLWIGAFVLMVIFRLEVDLEGVSQVSIAQAYVARLLLFTPIVLAQAATVSIGNLILGVPAAHPLAFIGTSLLIGIVYLNIIYALSTAFGHVGRGLVILIVIVQIPGATGIYPIEMMPAFFRALSPLLPFSYGIDALRETIGGYYGHHYAYNVGVLMAMMVLALALGLTLRKLFAHAHRLINAELLSTHLVASERVHIAGSGYRVADLLRVLQGREGFAAAVEQRSRHYGRVIRLVASAGALGLLALSIAASFSAQQKVLFLAMWVGWAVLIFFTIAALEYIRQSIVQSQELVTLSDDELRHAIVARSAATLAEEDK